MSCSLIRSLNELVGDFRNSLAWEIVKQVPRRHKSDAMLERVMETRCKLNGLSANNSQDVTL